MAQDCIIVENDCGTERGLTIRAVMDSGEVISSLSERILGRTLTADVTDPVSGEVLFPRNTLIEEAEAEIIEKAGVESVLIRSVLTCDSRVGVCGHCYGRDLARGTPVNIGEAVGVIAAQSIGEPGTQLTMRTFHIGGAATRGAEQSMVEASRDGKVTIRNRNVVQNSQNVTIVMSRNCEILLTDEKGVERARYRVPYGARLMVGDNQEVTRGFKMAEWDPYTLPIITEQAGTVEYLDLIDSITLVERMDEVTGLTSKVVVDYKQGSKGVDLRPRLQLKDLQVTSSISRTATKRATSCRPTRCCQSRTVLRFTPVTCWPVSRVRAPRPVTLRVVCRVWLNCLKPVVPRTMRLSRKPKVASRSARTTSPSAALS